MRLEQSYDLENMTSGRQPQHTPTPPSSKRHWWIAVLALAVVAILVVAGILPRIQARTQLAKDNRAMATPVVNVVQPTRSAPEQEIVLPANVQPYVDAPIYARTNGYLKRWYVDIGAHVKRGQLLAEIDTPEVTQQLQQARADLGTAEANLNLAKITADRYAGLLKTDSVSKQDADNAAGDYAAKQASVQSAEANVKRLEEMQAFQKIYAPFDGVITARNTDVGALIDSGASGGTRTELFHIAQPDRLRVYVNVPEADAQAAKPGIVAVLTTPSAPNRQFQGKLVRTADSIDQSTRTLLVEIDVNNPDGALLSGSYAEAHLKLGTDQPSAFVLPVNTLLFRSEGLRVATVDSSNRIVLVPITIGRDFGTEVEVVSGLQGGESVVINPPDSVIAGEEVRVAQPNQTVHTGAAE